MNWDFDNPSGLTGGAPSPGGFPTTANQGIDWDGATTQAPLAQDNGSFAWPAGTNAPGLSETAWGTDAGIGDPNGFVPPAAPLPAGSPPTVWIAGAATSAVLALAGALVALLVLSGSLPVAAASWVLAGPAAVLLLGEFVKRDEQQRARAFYDKGEWTRAASVGVGVVALLAVGVAAYVIADWVATR